MFPIGSSSFGKWYAIIGLQKEDLRNFVIVMRNKIKIDYYYWYMALYRSVSKFGKLKIVYFSTKKTPVNGKSDRKSKVCF